MRREDAEGGEIEMIVGRGQGDETQSGGKGVKLSMRSALIKAGITEEIGIRLR